MIMRKIAFALILLSSFSGTAQTHFATLGDVTLSTELNKEGLFRYAVTYKRQPVIFPSALGFRLAKPEVDLSDFSLVGVDSATIDDTWSPVWGEESSIRNHYKQLLVHLRDKRGSGILLDIIFRVFADGVGFRYSFPEQPGLQYFIVKDEDTHYHLAGDHKTFWIPGDFDSNEYQYNTTKLSGIDALVAAAKEKDIAVTSLIGPNAVQTPLMMKSSDGLYINIHEAALVNYPAANLDLDKSTLTFRTVLVPDAVGNKAYLHAPCVTPWRTVIVSDKATDILASRTILNLNEPTALPSTDWIRPQKFVGLWWEMHVGKATWFRAGGKHGATTENTKRYIDFAAAHHFDGVLVEGWNTGWEDWFGNWKEEVFDFVTPYPDYDINELTKYAAAKGVKLIMHHETSGSVTGYERRFDTAYRFMVQHGINTVKTGYVGKIIPRGEHHDGQWMVNHFNRVAAKTGEYHIMLDAHEPVHPTGLSRTFPNWMASEAARGTEFNNAPTLGILPEHNTILPFTRLMGGPMDYTPGVFHMRLNQFIPERTTRVRSTLARQLALYVTMYSPLQMAADLPENYEPHLDAFKFIEDVPVNWSLTRVVEAEPGDFVTIARRDKKSANWFLGSVTDENARTMRVKLDFLEAGKKYKARIYRDGKDADFDTNPESYQIDEQVVDSSSVLTVPIARGGGCAVSFIVM
jgi:hypothetical protein